MLGDASLDFYVEATGRPVALAEYFDRSYLASVDKSEAPSKLDPELLHSMMLRRQSAFANSATTWKMAQIASELHSAATIQFARDLTFRQIKTGNVILLGNQLSNPWIQSFEPHLSLVWVLDPETHSYYPQDKNVPESARNQFRSHAVEGNAHAGYATISYLSNPNGNGNVFILSATGGSATGVATNFLTDETSMIQLRSRLPKSPNSAFPYFDALLVAEKGSKGLNSAKLAICRPPATTATHNRKRRLESERDPQCLCGLSLSYPWIRSDFGPTPSHKRFHFATKAQCSMAHHLLNSFFSMDYQE